MYLINELSLKLIHLTNIVLFVVQSRKVYINSKMKIQRNKIKDGNVLNPRHRQYQLTWYRSKHLCISMTESISLHILTH